MCGHENYETIDFRAALSTAQSLRYDGAVAVEVSRFDRHKLPRYTAAGSPGGRPVRRQDTEAQGRRTAVLELHLRNPREVVTLTVGYLVVRDHRGLKAIAQSIEGWPLHRWASNSTNQLTRVREAFYDHEGLALYGLSALEAQSIPVTVGPQVS